METFEISSNKTEKNKKSHFLCQRLSEGYAYRRTPIVNSFLQSFCRVNHLYTTRGSRNMENHAISSLDELVEKPFAKCVACQIVRINTNIQL